jgi:3-oxoacyl-[acyl-carrier-protein] synthase-1
MPDDLHAPGPAHAAFAGGFVAAALDLEGPCLTVSTACSSSAKVFANAERMIRLGLIDAAVVGGVDTCATACCSASIRWSWCPANPAARSTRSRNGISIGEAAGFALLERVTMQRPMRPLLLGYGEASDAHHMSTPHPEGLGAELALRDALPAQDSKRAGRLHQPARHRQPEERRSGSGAGQRAFPASTRASSTKGFTGHTLGAAGIIEATIALAGHRARADSRQPRRQTRSAVRRAVRLDNEQQRVDVALSNSFGFGGNNACLAFARAGISA